MRYNNFKLGQFIDIGIANMCAIAGVPDATTVFKNSGQGGSTQFVYTAYGSGWNVSDVTTSYFEVDTITDISSSRGHAMEGFAGPNGCIWVGFNPKNESSLQYNYIVGPQHFNHIGNTDEPTVLVGLKYDTTANGKKIEPLNFALIMKEDSVDIDVPEGAIAILIWK
jgi:hypothetical protein